MPSQIFEIYRPEGIKKLLPEELRNFLYQGRNGNNWGVFEKENMIAYDCNCVNWAQNDIKFDRTLTGGHHPKCHLGARPDVIFLTDESGELCWVPERQNERDTKYMRVKS